VRSRRSGGHPDDEPCSALDPIATAKIEELIHELKGRYAIVNRHPHMQQAARVSQRTAFFHLGALVEYGATSDIFTNPKSNGPRITSPAATAEQDRHRERHTVKAFDDDIGEAAWADRRDGRTCRASDRRRDARTKTP